MQAARKLPMCGRSSGLEKTRGEPAPGSSSHASSRCSHRSRPDVHVHVLSLAYVDSTCAAVSRSFPSTRNSHWCGSNATHMACAEHDGWVLTSFGMRAPLPVTVMTGDGGFHMTFGWRCRFRSAKDGRPEQQASENACCPARLSCSGV